MCEPSNPWSPSITDIFFHRLCAAGTIHRQANDTYKKKLDFLASRIGLKADTLYMVSPLDYEKNHMWGWPVPLTPLQRRVLF